MSNYIKSNKAAWEEAFEKAEGYGAENVAKLETEEFPFLLPEFISVIKAADMKGKKVAQFFCNNGRELLSIVKNTGAENGVGFDIAENLVLQANKHAAATGIPCTFVSADALKIGRAWANKFDFAVITVGALCWIEDLGALFRVIRRCLKPDGVLLIHEYHPFTNMLGIETEPEFDPDHPTARVWPYFRDVPFVDAMGMHYMVGEHYPSKTFTSFAHTLSELMNALIANRLKITMFQEFANDVSDNFGHLDGLGMPLSFILAAKAE
ncbi:MAG TPA: SAM-dependent methyltransferase [Acholeplasmatales bacterium]|nr:MAG: hypothetical protein A2Y16_05605 [Tenericutes bacterium GWF2_57_13]HAQ56021.1 SAM-dependent methyltransferase [Acholeplasmatales bacterium]